MSHKFDHKANKILDLFNDKIIEEISNLELPNSQIKILEHLLKQTISDFKKVNKIKGQDFSERIGIMKEAKPISFLH